MLNRLLGTYLGKDVWLADIAQPSGLNDRFIDNTTMLIVIGDSVSQAERLALLDAVAEREPIVVMVAAHDTHTVWEDLADRVYLRENRKLTMAYKSEETEPSGRLEDLLFTAMPGEDRFDEWSGYVIVVWGEETSPYEAAILELCEDRT